MIRAFVAVELNPEVRAAVARLQEEIKNRAERALLRAVPQARIQWVRPESVHLTLKFLGDIDEARIAEVQQALERALAPLMRFAVEAGGLGAFPDSRAPRVLWVALGGPTNHLARLAAEVERALEPLGFPPEAKPFNAHLTLARIKERSREVGRSLAESGVMESGGVLGRLDVDAVALMKSELKPSGAVYTRLFQVPLAAG